ncbi:hypothetical protein IFM89_001604 [Coptis chinensis]|uniref:Protein kinase domain-containing protein n=1 Tax=Coptis chinensis TaxID=261450 RepID=A0A835HKB4_9MAGN|nr:hypothetical protein IFM89_001604 [Coptis chinensis]
MFQFHVFVFSFPTGTEFGVKGINGYIDPEYNATSRLSVKCDVYSFGVVLIELLYWKVIESQSFSELESVKDFMLSMECGGIHQIFDHSSIGEGDRAQTRAIATLALKCIRFEGVERPTMTEMAKELAKKNKRLLHVKKLQWCGC